MCKHSIRSAAAAALALAVAVPAAAQSDYPAKPIRIIVPFAAGGPTDVQSRWAAQQLNEALGKPVLVENRGGAGGKTGTEMVAKAAPDGYTLLGGNPGPLTVAPNIESKLGYDPQRDFAPLALLATATSMLCVHPSMPARNIREFVAIAKQRPGYISYGSPGVGTVGHLATELFMAMAGVKLLHVPYKGAAPYLVDLIAGHIDTAFLQVASGRTYVQQGKLRALGVSRLQRSPLLPDVPTIAEQGVPGFQSLNWTGLLVPAGTPREIVARLHGVLDKALKSPRGKELERIGFDVAAYGPDEYAKFLREETEKWDKVARAAGIKKR